MYMFNYFHAGIVAGVWKSLKDCRHSAGLLDIPGMSSSPAECLLKIPHMFNDLDGQNRDEQDDVPLKCRTWKSVIPASITTQLVWYYTHYLFILPTSCVCTCTIIFMQGLVLGMDIFERL